ncbi:MAG: Hsp20/alpha crystallin family protein [Planctomycetales bacterium]
MNHEVTPSGADKLPPPLTQAPLEHAVFTPPIDIYESGDDLVLRADVPGVKLESVDVQVQDNRLTIFGRVGSLIPENAHVLHQEFEVGDYLRSFILSDQVDHSRIVARLNQGLLEVVLPKAPKAQPRRIQVKED